MKVCPKCGNVCSYNSYFQKTICSKCGWEESNKERKAVYAGSFDPFTNGHLYVVKEASLMFDKVYVCIACNVKKKRHTSIIEMTEAIKSVIKKNHLENVEVIVCYGLVADFCGKIGADYLVRGLRNTSDYLYEENIAKINFEVNPSLKTVYFRSNNEVISSTLIRELLSYGKDISKYVPEDIKKILIN